MEKFVANREGIIFKSFITACRLTKAVESEQNLATFMSSKSISKLCYFKRH